MSRSMHAADCTCRDHPLPATMSVRDGLQSYLQENGFTLAAYDAPWTDASVLGVHFSVPNTLRHRWAIMLHDLHHIATGFGTDLTGEGEISAWETRRGLGDVGAYVAGIVLSATLAGLLIAPRRAWAAWRAPGAARSLFVASIDYDELLDLTIGDLRDRLGLPRAGLCGRRDLHDRAPAALNRGHAAAGGAIGTGPRI